MRLVGEKIYSACVEKNISALGRIIRNGNIITFFHRVLHFCGYLRHVVFTSFFFIASHAFIHTHIQTNIHTYAYLHTYMHTYLHTYKYSYIHVYIHTYSTYFLIYTHLIMHDPHPSNYAYYLGTDIQNLQTQRNRRQVSLSHTYIHRYIHTYIHTYIPFKYLQTYYIHTYIHAYILPYLHTFLQT